MKWKKEKKYGREDEQVEREKNPVMCCVPAHGNNHQPYLVFSSSDSLFLPLPLTEEGCHRSTLRERDSRDILPTTPPPPPPTSGLWYANLPLHHVSLACLHEGGGSVRAAAPTTPTSIMPTLSFSFQSINAVLVLSLAPFNQRYISHAHIHLPRLFPFFFPSNEGILSTLSCAFDKQS